MSTSITKQVLEILSLGVGSYMGQLQLSVACFMANVEMEYIQEKDLEILSEKVELLYETRFGKEIARNIKNKILAIPQENHQKYNN